MSKPLVSIIITSYNYSEYITQAVESTVEQTYPNIELIVIDDGSSDDSPRVVEALSKQYGFQAVLQANQGVIATRNKGMELAKGEYAMQLDADDYLSETYVEKCVTAAQRYKVDIVYTQSHVFGRTSFETKHIDFDLEKLKHDNFINAAALIKKSVLKEDPYDIYLDKLANEDWDLFLDVCLDGAAAKLVDEPLHYYRKHDTTKRMSRSDELSSLYKESLVRHHIWSKQNVKHPDQLWYFSSQIETLLSTIHLFQKYEEQEKEIELLKADRSLLQDEREQLKQRIRRLEQRDLPTIARMVKHRLKSVGKKPQQ